MSTTDTRLTVEDEGQYLLHLRGATVCKTQDKEDAADSRFISLAPHFSLSPSLSTYRYTQIYVPYKQLYHRLITTWRFQGRERERQTEAERQTE
jgi:hypothetical protein